jgi:hypothetical protein
MSVHFVISGNKTFVQKLPDIPQTPFKQAVPKEYKSDDSVEAYRQYYLGRKVRKSF